MGPGSAFGQMGVLTEAPRAASVVCAMACELLVISGYDYCRLIDAAVRPTPDASVSDRFGARAEGAP
eukprot:SAG11_NODE_1537_length_4724_cov_4.318270_10_plen_67_part_00